MESLYEVLIRLVAILLRNDSSWAKSVAGLAADLASATTEATTQDALRQLLAIYGGMGSFNDLVLQSRAGISPDNDELDELRSKLYSMASGMLR